MYYFFFRRPCMVFRVSAICFTTIQDQKELENLGMYIQESIYFENGMVVYKGYTSKLNKNKDEILSKYASVMMKK